MDNIFIRPYQMGLKVIGAWPGYAQLSGFFLAQGWQLVLVFFALWDVVEVFGNLQLLVDNMVNTIAVIASILKLTVFRIKRRALMNLMNKMLEDWHTKRPTEESKVMTDNFERSKSLGIVMMSLYNGIILTITLKPVISYINNSVEDRQLIAPLGFPKFLGNPKRSPMYEIVIIGQIGTTFFAANSDAIIEGLLALSVFHACSKMDDVRRELLKFSNACRSQSGNKALIMTAMRRLIQVHIKCDEFSDDVDNLFTVISFIHIFFLTLGQVFCAYMFICNFEDGEDTVKTFHYASLAIVILISCGFYCIAGEYLTSQSELLIVDVYNCFWNEFPVSQQKVIKFILAKTQRPVHLTFGKFDKLNFVHLTKIIKTSFSYLSLVRQVH